MSIEALCKLHTATVQVKQKTRSASMGIIEDWVDVAPVECRINPMSAKTISEYAQRGYEVSHAIYFSSDPKLTTKNRLRYKGRNFDFVSMANAVEMDRLWKVVTIERSDDPDRSVT